MAKLPYGFDPQRKFIDKDPWVNLKTIGEFLQDGETVPPDLAHWLGEAIRHSKEDPAELMRRLGLKKNRGRPSQSDDAWLIWGERVCELEDQGHRAEEAIEISLRESEDLYSRSQLQTWRNQYRNAKK